MTPKQHDFGRPLLPQHVKLIEESGISDEVARERGYRSIEQKTVMKGLGFGAAQCRVPALVIPVWGVTGEIVSWQSRPDDPRVVNGKALKYETPAKSRICLDVPPMICKNLGAPSIPLFITEGARKADAAVSRGLTCIALLGVWNWRGTNDWGGKTVLPDWEYVALKDVRGAGRDVYIVFDSDVMTKRAVYQAMARLKAFLEQRGAIVRVVYLPQSLAA